MQVVDKHSVPLLRDWCLTRLAARLDQLCPEHENEAPDRDCAVFEQFVVALLPMDADLLEPH